MGRRIGTHALDRPRNRHRVRHAIAILASVGMAGGLCATIAANATVTSPANNTVYRGGAVRITEDTGGVRRAFDGTVLASTATTCTSLSASPPASDPFVAGDTNHTRIKIFKPGDAVNPIVNQVSPPRHVATVSVFKLYDRGGAFTYDWTIPDDAEAGIYTIQVTTVDRKKSTSSALSTACAAQAGTTTTRTIEYRPWTNKFKDFFGNGDVSFNLFPREFAATIHGVSTPIINGNNGRMRAFSVSDPESGLTLPDDPSACADDPTTCLPAGAAECAANDTDCDARLVVINWQGSSLGQVKGIFDLETKAFIAAINYKGNTGVLVSFGTEAEGALAELLAQIAAFANEQGVDLMSLLATRVKVTLNNEGKSTVVAVSLLRALQIYSENPGGPTGVSIEAPLTATIGLFAHSYRFSNVPNPTGVASAERGCSTAASNGRCSLTQPETTGTNVGRFTPTSGFGYNVLKSDLLPDLPKIGLPVLPVIPGLPALPVSPSTVTGLAALGTSVIPTKFFNIHGTWPTAACDGSIISPHSGCHTPKIGVSTNPGEPNGLPVWIAPLSLLPADPTVLADPDTATATALGIALQALLGLGLPGFADKSMDFLGTASWSTTETCTATTCSGSGSMSGLGVGIFTDKPLPIGFRNIPIWDPQSPEVVGLIATINQAIADAQVQGNEQLAALLADPTVVMVLEAIFGNLPPIPALPEAPAVPLP